MSDDPSPTVVIVKSPSAGWTIELEVAGLYGDARHVAKRLRAEGADARLHRGEVWVNADSGVT